MNSFQQRRHNVESRFEPGYDASCAPVRAEFSAYLDGAITGVAMAAIAAHLDTCGPCAQEFEGWRTVQRSLAELGPATPPARLQTDLLQAIAIERGQGTHLSLSGKLAHAWQNWLAPVALRAAGGLTAALVLIGGIAWMFAAPLAVQANDDEMAHLVAPHYLYSEVPPLPVPSDRDTPVMVEALVDASGQVYDYTILAGPSSDAVRVRIQENLLSSVFRPATLFGVPVRGHVVLTYMGVSVHG